ncbi:MAG: sulfotransferase domain-containing protein [Devosia sp.]|uniref:sulfotransferase domain-containing protein n=1 Tax=Devosia sp. TaxID=1871048 RepID=UPI001ACAD8AB|nr:sulfotransferase domain-containing protein [Devosia sp.]MBN9317794.1 sulfotransferase domain-containing protein [Devosia sp.]
MTTAPVVWLASYPRSGNTFLRTIIYHCFGVRSASIYAGDLGELGVGDMVGHIEQRPDGSIDFGNEPVRLLKTHHPPQDDRPTIYIIRDGRAASTSLYEFYKKRMPLRAIIEGRNIFGTWTGHLRRWNPLERPSTLFLRYEDMVQDTRGIIDRLAEYLGLRPNSYLVPSREDLARADGTWIRHSDSKRTELEGEDLQRFWEINGKAMESYGYARLAGPSEPARLT